MDTGTIKLLVAIVLFSVPVLVCAETLPKREIAGRRLTRPQAQAAGAVIGLVLGIGFLLATG
ncbi:hypothetical protein [Roseomonas sp. AR75]|uniref:hypothetical protein n=1 Tax=Roseomonas sp. AR75 TaxID=2562311 RepID=UPI0010C0EE87|nr:hypothetical protein [Roseomonas sp. AR75]